jgi:hypothetical protein
VIDHDAGPLSWVFFCEVDVARGHVPRLVCHLSGLATAEVISTLSYPLAPGRHHGDGSRPVGCRLLPVDLLLRRGRPGLRSGGGLDRSLWRYACVASLAGRARPPCPARDQCALLSQQALLPDRGRAGRGSLVDRSKRPSAAWHQSEIVPGPGHWPITGVSCRSDRLCVAIDSRSRAYISTDPESGVRSWHATRLDTDRFPIPTQGFPLAALACAPARVCIAGDVGDVFVGRTDSEFSNAHSSVQSYRRSGLRRASGPVSCLASDITTPARVRAVLRARGG